MTNRVEFNKENSMIASRIMYERGLIKKNEIVKAVEYTKENKIKIILFSKKNKKRLT